MSTKKDGFRSATGVVINSETIKTSESMKTLKTGDTVVIIHSEDYKRFFDSIMNRINKMDEELDQQVDFVDKNIKIKNKGLLGRFKIRKE